MKDKSPPATQPPPDFDAAVDSDRTPLDWPRHTGRLDRVMDAITVLKKKQRRQRRQIAATTASVLLIAGGVWFSKFSGSPAAGNVPAPSRAIVATPERRTLPDGSTVELKDGSEIAVDFSGPLRRVALGKGEAHFQVAKNPLRAFVVTAGGMEFRAVGTAFAVQLGATKVEMIVTEGRVAVERAPSRGAQPANAPARATTEPLAVVDAGNQIAVDIATATLIASQPNALTSAESEAKLAWRVPRLELSDTPLAEVLAAINEHGPVRLELGDGELGKVQISGKLRADNVETLLRMLESNYGIQGDRHESGKIILRKAR